MAYIRTPKQPKSSRQQNFVDKLRWAQERLGLTLREMANSTHADVSEAWLRRVATQGVKWVKKGGAQNLAKLSAYLGCDPDSWWDVNPQRFQAGVSRKHGFDPASGAEIAWDRVRGWRICESAIDYVFEYIQNISVQSQIIGVPFVQQLRIERESIKLQIDIDAYAMDVWLNAYTNQFGFGRSREEVEEDLGKTFQKHDLMQLGPVKFSERISRPNKKPRQ
jgi:hypothetical protein